MRVLNAVVGVVITLLVLGGVLAYLAYVGAVDTPLKALSTEYRRAQPYLSQIESDNLELRSIAARETASCPAGNRECQVNRVFRYVVDTYAYLSDPQQKELIRSPEETMQNKGGDCEDFTILMNSLLENIGFHTYMVLTDDHAYGLVCDIDPGLLRQYVEEDLLKRVAQSQSTDDVQYVYEQSELFQIQRLERTFSIPSNSAYFLGGDGSELEHPFLYKRFSYEASFTGPLDMHVVAGKPEYQKLVAEESYREYDCAQLNVLRASGTCDRMGTDSGIVFVNDGESEVTMNLELDTVYHYSARDLLKNVSITSYRLNGEVCVVLDGTSGEFGYPGFSGDDLKGDKIVVDPETKMVWKLG